MQLHQLGYVHNDIKLSNIGIRSLYSVNPIFVNFNYTDKAGNSGQFKGTERYYDLDKMYQLYEHVKNSAVSEIYNPANDIWSLGIVFY